METLFSTNLGLLIPVTKAGQQGSKKDQSYLPFPRNLYYPSTIPLHRPRPVPVPFLSSVYDLVFRYL